MFNSLQHLQSKPKSDFLQLQNENKYKAHLT